MSNIKDKFWVFNYDKEWEGEETNFLNAFENYLNGDVDAFNKIDLDLIEKLEWKYVKDGIETMWIIFDDGRADTEEWMEPMYEIEDRIMKKFSPKYNLFYWRTFLFAIGEEYRFYEFLIQKMMETKGTKGLIGDSNYIFTYQEEELIKKYADCFDNQYFENEDWLKKENWYAKGNGDSVGYYESIDLRIEGFEGNFCLEIWANGDVSLIFYPGEEK